MLDLIERRCLEDDCLLEQPVKQLPPVCGTAAIESEGEFVQVIAQLKFGKAAMMNPKKPTLEQGSGVMDSWHKLGSRFLSTFGHFRPIYIAQLGYVHVDGQPIRDDHRAGNYGFLDERHQVFLGGVRNLLNPNSASSGATDLRSDNYQ